MGIFSRIRERRRLNDWRQRVDSSESVGQNKNLQEPKKRRRLFPNLFDPVRIKKRRDFRVKVSGNRKWIMIGIAAVAICGTVVYLSITYGGGIMGILKP